jgi:uridylate kinase
MYTFDIKQCRRILIKLSGEALASLEPSQEGSQTGLNGKMLSKIVHDIDVVRQLDINIAVVVGGGNFFRGVSQSQHLGMEQAASDQIGMLATVMNGLALQECFLKAQIPCSLYSAFSIGSLVDSFNLQKARESFERGNITIFVGGCGHPYFTTDTTAALRARQMNCDVVFKATKVKGIYSEDPLKNKNATFYPLISYENALKQNLKVMDQSSLLMLCEARIPTVVFSLYDDNSLGSFFRGSSNNYTLVHY